MEANNSYNFRQVGELSVRASLEFSTAFNGKETGHVEEVFGDGKFSGELERLVIEFILIRKRRLTRDPAFAEMSAGASGPWQCLQQKQQQT